jgi:hypothetical protein
MNSTNEYALPLPAGPKENIRVYEYKLKSIIKKKTNQTGRQGTSIDIVNNPQP